MTMLGDPTMADESQIRLPAAYVESGHPPREDHDDSNPDDDPRHVHREGSCRSLFATIGA